MSGYLPDYIADVKDFQNSLIMLTFLIYTILDCFGENLKEVFNKILAEILVILLQFTVPVAPI